MRQTHMAWADGQRTTHDGPLDACAWCRAGTPIIPAHSIQTVQIDPDAEHAVDAIKWTTTTPRGSHSVTFELGTADAELIAMLFGVPMEMIEDDPLADLLAGAGIHEQVPDAAERIRERQQLAEWEQGQRRDRYIADYYRRPR